MITIAELNNLTSSSLSPKLIQEFINTCNDPTIIDPEDAKLIKDNLITYSFILKQGRFKLMDYLHAIRYVSYKIMGYNNKESYQKTFPNIYARWISNKIEPKDINARINSYNKNKLVNLIYEQSHIPTWILNQDAFQKAINTQLDIMINSKSDMARVQAANSLLTHLKKPEVKEIDVKITEEDNTGLKELKNSMKKLAKLQINQIENGISTHEISQFNIIDVTPNDHN